MACGRPLSDRAPPPIHDAREVISKKCIARDVNACKRAQNQFDSIDLSDNAVVKLEGFPRLHRLKQLLLNNNRVTRIERKLEGEESEKRVES